MYRKETEVIKCMVTYHSHTDNASLGFYLGFLAIKLETNGNFNIHNGWIIIYPYIYIYKTIHIY
jgi:hypothetical protein